MESRPTAISKAILILEEIKKSNNSKAEKRGIDICLKELEDLKYLEKLELEYAFTKGKRTPFSGESFSTYFLNNFTESFSERQKKRIISARRIVDMDMSVRLLNCLKAQEIDCLEDIQYYTEKEISNFTNVGKSSLEELKKVMQENNLYFKNQKKKNK